MSKLHGKQFTGFGRSQGPFAVLADAIAERFGLEIRRSGFWPCTDGKTVKIPESAMRGAAGEAFLIACIDEMGAVAKLSNPSLLLQTRESLLLNQLFCSCESARLRPALFEEFRGASFFCQSADRLWAGMIQSGQMDPASAIVALCRLEKAGLECPLPPDADALLQSCKTQYLALVAAKTAEENLMRSRDLCEALASRSPQAAAMAAQSAFGSGKSKKTSAEADKKLSELAKSIAEKLAGASAGHAPAVPGLPGIRPADTGGASSEGSSPESEPSESPARGKPSGKPWNRHAEDGGSALLKAAHTDLDITESFAGKGDRSFVAELKNEAKSAIGAMTRRFELSLRSKEKTLWRFERERGSLDARSLSKLAASPGFRMPFKDKKVFEARKTAVAILVDLSGSMEGGRDEVARLAAVAMSEALNRLGVACCVLGFSSGPNRQYALREREIDRGDQCAGRTYESLYLREFKSFDNPSLSGLSEIKVHDSLVQNPDGECLAWAATLLSERKEERKILFTLSDGMPETEDTPSDLLAGDLKSRAKSIVRDGIELVGIGIQTDAVKRFYPEWIVVKNLSCLAEHALRKLEKILLHGAVEARP